MNVEMLMVLVAAAPIEALIEMLDESLTKYKINPNKENLTELMAVSMMFSMRGASFDENPAERMFKALQISKDVSELSKLQKIMKGKLG